MADTLRQTLQSRDRQRFTRRSTLLRATLRDGESTVECDLLDISAGGAKLRTPVPFAIGAQVLLSVGKDHQFQSRVTWREGEALGLHFLEPPEAVAAVIPEILESHADQRERRRHGRSTVLWSGEIYGGLRRAKCEILNISSSGAKLHTNGHFPAGTEIIIRSIRFGEFQARVIWQDKERATIGIEFLDDDERIAQIIERNLPSIRKQED